MDFTDEFPPNEEPIGEIDGPEYPAGPLAQLGLSLLMAAVLAGALAAACWFLFHAWAHVADALQGF